MDFTHPFITTSPQETAQLGKKLGTRLIQTSNFQLQNGEGDKHATVVCLYGELGSGKTTFVQGTSTSLGLTARLPSPTFFIVRRYLIPKKTLVLYHIDLYRIQSQQEARDIGLSDILHDPNAIVFIEWADKLARLLPKNRIDVRFLALEDGSHRITIEHTQP